MSTLIRSFGRGEEGFSNVEEPDSVVKVQELFKKAAANKKKVTIRGGGHSFDGQAVHDGDTGENMIIDTKHFQCMKFLPDNKVKLGAGVPWCKTLKESVSKGLVPAVMQTGGAATAGGTLGGDCLSRFSCALGKESEWIESFYLVPPHGEPVTCSRRENPDKFFAAIGGHGYIGFVTDIVYQLVPILRSSFVHTDVKTYDALDPLLRDLVPAANDARKNAEKFLDATAPGRGASAPDPSLPSFGDIKNPVTALSSAIFESLTGEFVGAIFKSRYTALELQRHPHFPLYHDLKGQMRYLAEIAARDTILMRGIHVLLFTMMKVFNHQFHDDIDEFTFFMDGTTHAKERFERETGQVMPITQQTFVVPERLTKKFVEGDLKTALHRHKLNPTEIDILYVLQDQCYLSATRDHDGFAVTVAFENYTTKCPPPEVDAFLRELTTICAREYDGRIHLVKNLRADPADVQYMLRSSIDDFKRVKKDVDPDGILWNPFFAKIFG